MKIDIDAMYQVAEQARQHSHSPYSHFSVGSCVLTETGKMFGGCNVENASYPLGQCAEASAIGNMVTQLGPQKIRAILIVVDTHTVIGSCGGCLQKILEFATPETEIIMCNTTSKRERRFFKEFL